TQTPLQGDARHLSPAAAQGALAVSHAQNRLSTVNRTLEVRRRDQQVRVSPSAALGLNRCNLRTRAPQGQERTQLLPLRQALREQGFERVAAIIHLARSEEHTSELQSRENLVCRLLLEKKNYRIKNT